MAFDFMLYPTFTIVEGRGLIPNIHLPKNYKELVPKFYKQQRKEDVEEYAEQLSNLLKEQKFSGLEIRLQWSPELGLTNISIGPSGGLDLSKGGWPSFQEHNLGTRTSLITGAIAMKYISELLKT